MRTLMPMVCLLLLLSPSVFGQEFSMLRDEPTQKSEFDTMIDLRLQTMQIACSEAIKNRFKLDIVADQQIAIKGLSKDYEQKVQTLVETKKVESEANDKKAAALIERLDDLERRLSNKILQPDQTKALHSLVFAQLVKANDGDLSTTLTTYYPKRFKFDDDQQTQMEELGSTAEEKIAEAKETFEEELEEIAAETETEVRDILTPKQIELLEELQSE